MYLNELDTRYDDASRRTAKALRDYAEENNQAMLKVDPEGSMDYDLFLTVADAIEANDVDTVAKEISDADTDPRDFMMDLLLDNHPEMAKIVSMKVDNTIQNIFGMTGRMPESTQVNEGYEKTCLNALRQEGIGGYFSNGKLYVDFRDLDRAKEVIASDPDILEAPQIIGEETVIEAKYEFGPATGKETYPGGYEHDARMITHIVTDLSPRLKDDEVMLDVQNAINRIETNTATKADITLVMDVYKDIVKQKLDKPYKDAIGKFDQDYDPNDPLQNVEEKAKPDFLDIDGDDNKTEPMKKAVKDKEKKEKVKEGKVKAMLMDMEDDASDMSREEFISKYGSHNADVWDDVNNPKDYPEPNFESVNEANNDALMAWYNKYNKYKSADVHSLADGMFRFYMDSGVDLDTAEKSEYEAMVKKYGEDRVSGNVLNYIEEMPITNAMFTDFESIMGQPADEDSVAKAQDMLDPEPALNDLVKQDAESVDEDVEDQTKIIRLKMMQDQVEDLKSNFEILTRLDQRGTGAGDLQDQITTMYKAIESLQGVLGRSMKIVPETQNLDVQDESKKVVKEMTSAENTVHKAFELAQSQINILERKFRPGGLIENKTKEIGGDASIFPEVQDKLADVYDVLEDAHYDAMGHVHNENISERTLTKAEKKKMKSYEKDIKKKDFIERYGKEKGESVYYATITKMAKKNA